MPFDPTSNQFKTNAAVADLTDNSGGSADDTIAAVTGDASVVDAIADLVDNSGGTANDTIAAVTGDASVVDAIADLAAKVNAILAALRVASIIDD